MKTNKSVLKRIKLTKNGKVKMRMKGQNHFNAKESGNTTRAKRGVKQDMPLSKKTLSRLLPHQ